jgi:Holliday junction DNA helicase RuvB
MKEADIELLRRIAEAEDSLDPESLPAKLGWRSRDVGVWPGALTKLRMEGLVEDVYESNSYHGYRLTPKARAMLLNGAPNHAETKQNRKLEVPEDIFQDIIGHDDVKELLRACLLAEKPVHVLLTGPPALAKTLFLWDIERVGGEKALWLVGSAISKAGLWDMVAERRPEVLLVDELDKVNAADTAALLSIMEGGRMVRAKKGRELDTSIEVKVVAATNVESKLSPELRSRFAIRRLGTYSKDEFRTVVRGVLVRREGISPPVAEEIAERLDGRSQDVRDAVRVARLTPDLGVQRAIELLFPGG